MGIYTEKFRQLTDGLPKTPDQFTNPMMASSAMAQLTNAVLQVLASLEEELEDEQKRAQDLEDRLMEKTSAGSSDSPSAPFWDRWKG